METFDANGLGRRAFLKGMAGLGGAFLAAGCAGSMGSAGATAAARMSGTSLAALRRHPGIQTFTVRDQLSADFEGTLAKLAEIGYKEVEFAGSLNNLTPQQVRAILDRHGLSAPSTHIGVRAGPDLERTLEGYAVIGHRYTAASGAAPAAPPAPGAARPAPQPVTQDSVKRQADTLNQIGMVAKKYGIKPLIHNHTNEFAPLSDNPALRPYDILLAQTDPSLVALELDIGWATVAGEDALQMFRKNPGRYELWHVKDMADLAAVHALATEAERQRAAKIVPVGDGEIDYRPIFAAAGLSGMKHYFVEQDTAPQYPGGALVAAQRSYQSLMRVLA